MYTDANVQDRLNLPSHGSLFLTFSSIPYFNFLFLFFDFILFRFSQLLQTCEGVVELGYLSS
ncbi:hypothetical protein BDV41DRAFT_516716 [Aspergillus transmontanensis]|uniref:Uncharacterized protein n=1 Tax=Aspergillus transmontanensis TaxID=1034304 RepID=A0A5N6WII3_9EURO|nr:hypothetical protein BDV41DRAFT_516716 [Aspergillus transmontanensis]